MPLVVAGDTEDKSEFGAATFGADIRRYEALGTVALRCAGAS